MECLFAFVVLIIVLVAIATQKFSSTSGINDAYTRLAGRFGGRVTRGGWWRKPHVRFVWHGAHVLVQAVKARGAGGGYFTEVIMNWPDDELRLEVYPAGVWSRVNRVLGDDSMRIGAVAFDEHYVIHASSNERARHFLSAGVQWHIDRICRLMHSGDVFVGVDRGYLSVRKKSLLSLYADLETFVKLSMELFEQALLTQTAGIEFVSGPLPIGPAKCRVCGDGIDEDIVHCRRCNTPHHRECWHYNGACSTYGCGETRFHDAQPPATAHRN